MKELHHGIKLLGTATVGPKGQVVIPVEARDQMQIESGDKLVVLYVKEKNTVCFVTEEQVQKIVDKMGANLEGIRAFLGKR